MVSFSRSFHALARKIQVSAKKITKTTDAPFGIQLQE